MEDGPTPLHHAVQRGHLEVARLLCDAGANKDLADVENGSTPLYIAAEHGHVDMARLLCDAGALQPSMGTWTW
jgi:ankyrin repeat protein